jgi:hypothetical protein
MPEFFVGLALIAIGALATTAIKYPKGYKRLYWPLLGLTLLVLIGTAIFSVGYTQGAANLYPYLDGNKLTKAFEASELGRPPMGWITLAAMGFNIFLGIFYVMPTILGISEDDNKKSDGEDKDHPPG